MRYLSGDQEKKALGYIAIAAEVAQNSTCQRSRCGSIVVHERVPEGESALESMIIGRGFNSPPGEKGKQRRCSQSKDSYHAKVTDKTCCVHAEQRAIVDALKINSHKIAGSRLYFIRLDEDGKPSWAGKPYCTICSKLALDVGIKEFILWREQGVGVYDTEEYNSLSFQYKE